MDRERVANSPILNIQQVVDDPHLNERGYFVEVKHPIIGKAKIPGVPFQLSETPGEVERPSPLVGEHNELILRKYLGIGREEVKKLKEEGVI
jgi:CoA:oxalate CoA-transferase